MKCKQKLGCGLAKYTSLKFDATWSSDCNHRLENLEMGNRSRIHLSFN